MEWRWALLAVVLVHGCGDDTSSSVEATSTPASTSVASSSSDSASSTASAPSSSSSSSEGGGSSSTVATEPAEPGTFTLLTYNVAGLPQGISSSNPEVNMPQISPLLNTFDVVVAQEDFWYHAELSADAEHPYVSVPWPEELQAFIGDGLNRFSQFPFEPVERTAWPGCNGQTDCASDCLATKGWSFARTTLAPGVEVDVYNLHMEAGGCPEDIAIREQSAMDLAAALGDQSADRAVVMAGDFNLRFSDPEDIPPLETLLQAGLRDVCQEVGCTDGNIDHVMIRDGADVRLESVRWWQATEFVDQRSGDPLSDHPAVAVELRYVPQ
jgi:endonuclease/exonuclease/phosphatase family metal-dependent hydrolase